MPIRDVPSIHRRRPSPFRRVSILLSLVLAAGFFAPGPLPRRAAAQNVDEALRQLSQDNGALYAQPVVSGLGAAMNSAWFHTARVRGPVEFFFGVRAMGAFVPSADERFEPVLPTSVTVEQLGNQTYVNPYGTGESLVTPTVAGQGEGLVVEPTGQLRQDIQDAGLNVEDFALTFPDGFDLPAVPLAMGQAVVGLPVGTEVTFRFIPSIAVNDDVGSVEAFGVGGKHSVTQWIPGPTPLDVAVLGGWQTFDVGSYLSATSRTVGLAASRAIGPVELYGAGALEDSDVTIAYTVENPSLPDRGTDVRFTGDGRNSSRLTVGAGLHLGFFRFTADYTASDYDVVTASLGLDIF